jgi:Leucine-rich repeat (LRR) protein
MKCEFLLAEWNGRNVSTCHIVNAGKPEIGWVLDLPEDSKVKIFDIQDDKNIEFMPDNIGLKFPSVEVIWITNCSLQSLEPRQLKHLAELHYLVLNDNLIGEIKSGTFDELPELEYLDLQRNKIETLSPKLFERLKNLKDLLLSVNFIKTLDENIFVNNHNLIKVWLDGNQIEVLSSKVFEGKEKLYSVELAGNRCINDYYNSESFSRLKSDLLTKCATKTDVTSNGH